MFGTKKKAVENNNLADAMKNYMEKMAEAEKKIDEFNNATNKKIAELKRTK